MKTGILRNHMKFGRRKDGIELGFGLLELVKTMFNSHSYILSLQLVSIAITNGESVIMMMIYPFVCFFLRCALV